MFKSQLLSYLLIDRSVLLVKSRNKTNLTVFQKGDHQNMSDLENLREKLDKAINSFKKKDTDEQMSEYKEQHSHLIRITKLFSKLQNIISDQQTHLDNIVRKHDASKSRVEFELNRFKKGIFDDLVLYKSVHEKDEVDNLLTAYQSEKEESLYENVYRKLIEGTLRNFRNNIRNDEIFVEKIKSLERDNRSFASICNTSIKGAGLDPTLYKYYSSTDDLSIKTEEGRFSSAKKQSLGSQKTENNSNEDRNISLTEGCNNRNKQNNEGLEQRKKQEDLFEQSFWKNNTSIASFTNQNVREENDETQIQHQQNNVARNHSQENQTKTNLENVNLSIQNTSQSNTEDKELDIKPSDIVIEDEPTDEKMFSDSEIKCKINEFKTKNDLKDKKVMEDRIEMAKDEIRREENEHKFNLTTIHGLKEKIHLLFKKMNLTKLEMSENLLEKYEKNFISSEQVEKNKELSREELRERDIKNRVKSILLKMQKEISNVDETYAPRESGIKMRISKRLFELQKHILNDKERVTEIILSDVQSIICQGSLENDTRLLEKINKQQADIDKFDTPRFFKISVQMEIAKKYIKDIIFLKKRALLHNYYKD